MGNVVTNKQDHERDADLFLGSRQSLGVPRLPQSLHGEYVATDVCPDSTDRQTCSHGESAFISGLAGLIAGFTNIMVTFPINKVMLRQQLDGLVTRTAIDQMKKEGFVYLYRGMGPILLQKTTSTCTMFGAYGRFSAYVEHSHQVRYVLPTRHQRNFLAGAMSGAVESLLTPFERIQALLIDSKRHMQFKNTIDTFRHLRGIHLKELYRGYTCILLRNCVTSSLWFSLRSRLNDNLLPNRNSAEPFTSKSNKVLFDFCTGSLLGASLSTLFYPLAVAKMHMMTCVSQPYISIVEALKQTYIQRNRSLPRLYTGALINFPRAMLGWGIVNAVYEFALTVLKSNEP